MSYSIFVEIFKEINNLCYVEDFDVLVQLIDVGLDETDELTSLTVLQYEV